MAAAVDPAVVVAVVLAAAVAFVDVVGGTGDVVVCW